VIYEKNKEKKKRSTDYVNCLGEERALGGPFDDISGGV
jgi:hypothetical protein